MMEEKQQRKLDRLQQGHRGKIEGLVESTEPEPNQVSWLWTAVGENEGI